jgi:hypothetical protein
MNSTFAIKDLFKLRGGLTVLACEGDGDLRTVKGHTGTLMNRGEVRQSFNFSGERTMLNPTRARTSRAFETLEEVHLSAEEAKSGAWTLRIDS